MAVRAAGHWNGGCFFLGKVMELHAFQKPRYTFTGPAMG